MLQSYFPMLFAARPKPVAMPAKVGQKMVGNCQKMESTRRPPDLAFSKHKAGRSQTQYVMHISRLVLIWGTA
jgi:hypothetical protein